MTGMSYINKPFNPNQSPTIPEIRKRYTLHLIDYEAAIQTFIKTLHAPNSTADNLREAFGAMRDVYKRMEFLLAYFDEENARDFLNGPPLPSVNRVVAGVEVIPPSGMQPIEELLFEDSVAFKRKELLELTLALEARYKPVMTSQKQLPFTDRQVMEAVRAGILRVMALGLTGFDTPASGRAISESAIAIEAMKDIVALYLPYCKQKTLSDSIAHNFAKCVQYMRNEPDFDTFDRMACIRLYLEPLYGQCLRLHLDLGVEMQHHVNNKSVPVEYQSASIFSASAFNSHYYSGIGAKTEKQEAVTLGRMLFFDPILSANNQRACASCHQAERAFTDGQPKSTATDHGSNVGRNAPTVINSIIADKFFHDLRADRAESQIEHVISNEKEFNTSYYDILDKLNQSEGYRLMFEAAFGKQPNIADVIRALAAYIRELKTFNSPVDRYLRNEPVRLEPEIEAGFNLFMGKALCGTCHFAPTFSGLVPPYFTENESEVIGVPMDPKANRLKIDPDLGRYENGRPRDRAEHFQYSFKTPTLRNIALTAPYMHNGAYNTLEEVVDFYNKGGGSGLGLDVPHQTLPFDRLQLSDKEQQSLVRFMEALTDTTGMCKKPQQLPRISNKPELDKRTIGGLY